MQWRHLLAIMLRDRTWLIPTATGAAVASLAANPAPLLPAARAYRSLCERYPPLALLTFHAPALPLALLLLFAGLALIAGTGAGFAGFVRTNRFNRRLRRSSLPVPSRLHRIAVDLGVADRLTYLPWTEPAACCYGFLRPRVAVSAALVARLDDEEVTAVLAHEREHMHRRDPLRYLVLHGLTAAAFMFPVAPALRRRQEMSIELAADRAALAVAPRGALAGALLAVLNVASVRPPGAAWLSATEVRIAQLSGRAVLPRVPAGPGAVSIGLVVVMMLTAVDLASANLIEIVCSFCATRS